MLISFLGSRGSGKTTVADAVDKKFQAEGLTVLRQHEGLKRKPLLKSIFNAIYLWRFLDFEMMRSFGFLGREKRVLPSTYRLYLPLAIARDIHQVKKEKADILIYDSNILRALIKAVECGDIDLKLVADLYARKILSQVGKALLVVIDTNPDEAIKRWAKRDGVEVSNSEKETEIQKRKRDQAATDKVLKALDALPTIEVLRLDGSKSPDANASAVVARFKKDF